MGLSWNMGDDVQEGTINVHRLNQFLQSKIGDKKYYAAGYKIVTSGSTVNAMTVYLSNSATKYINNLIFRIVKLNDVLNSEISLDICNIGSGSVPSGSSLIPVSKQSNALVSQADVRYCNSQHEGVITSVSVNSGDVYWSSVVDNILSSVGVSQISETLTSPKTLKPGEGAVVKLLSSNVNDKFLFTAEWDEFDLSDQWWETQVAVTSSIFSPLDETGLPSWMYLSRSSGLYSYQVAPPVSGTIFIVTGSSPNTPRFHWTSGAKTRGLLLEPERTNIVATASFTDQDTNNIPDGWTIANGSAPTHWYMGSDSPAGGRTFVYTNVATPVGVQQIGTLSAGKTYAVSCWLRMLSVSGSIRMLNTNPGLVAINNLIGPFDWKITSSVASTVGVGDAICGLTSNALISASIALTQVESGSFATTFIPVTGTSQTRPIEKLVIDESVMPLSAGVIEFDWIPGFSSTDTLDEFEYNTVYLLGWGDSGPLWLGSNLSYYAPMAQLALTNNLQSNANFNLGSFTAWNNSFHIRIEFGPGSGSIKLIVDGQQGTNWSARWAPSPGPGYLGSHASGNVAPGVYKNIRLVKYL